MLQQFQDGETRVINGTTYVRQGGQWTAQRPAQAPQVVVPRQPPPQTEAQQQVDEGRAAAAPLDAPTAQANLQRMEMDNAEARRRIELREEARNSRRDQALNVIRSIDEARGLIGGWSTGLVGQTLDDIGGTQAHDLQSQLDTVIANIGFDRLQRMRAESPTGAALGPVSDFENRNLQASIASLRTSQTAEQLRENLDRVELSYLNVLATMRGQQPYRDLEEARRQAQNPFDTGTVVDIGSIVREVQGQEPPPTDPRRPPPGTELRFLDEIPEGDPLDFTPDEREQIRQFARTARTPEEIVEFADRLTNGRQTVTLESATRALDQYRRTGIMADVGRRTPPDISDVRGGETMEESDRERLDAAVRGAADTASLGFADEISAGANTLFGEGSYAENLSRERAIDAYDAENYFLPRITGQIGGGFGLRFPRGFGPQIRRGALYGGAYGFGSGESPGGRIENAFAGATIGAVAPAAMRGLGLAGNRAREILNRRRSGAYPNEDASAQEIAEAMIAEEIPGGRPIADPSVRARMANLETTRGGHETVRAGLENTRRAIEGRVRGLQGEGNVQTPGGMGETIRGGVSRQVQATRERASRFYDRASEMAGDTQVNPTEALATLDAHIAELARSPRTNSGVLAYLRGVRSDLAQPGRTVADIRNIRRDMSGEINRRNLGTSNAERLVNDALSAARRDIQRDLGTINPEALRFYERGDEMWQRMATDRRQLLEGLTGSADSPVPGERVMDRVTRMMRNTGDARRFRRIMDTMSPEERADFRATLVEPLGRRSADEPFSPAVFLNNTRPLQREALETVFGRDGAQSIINLRLASQGFAAASNSLNRSRTGVAVNFKNFVSSIANLRHAPAGAAGYSIAGWPGAVAGTLASEGIERGAHFLSARSLMNPDVSAWIRRVSNIRSETGVRRAVRELGNIAERNPAISQEVLGFRDLLLRAANDNFMPAGRVAASPDERPEQQ